ncbi:hypothetical protein D9M71_362920 [compost metagenome]
MQLDAAVLEQFLRQLAGARQHVGEAGEAGRLVAEQAVGAGLQAFACLQAGGNLQGLGAQVLGVAKRHRALEYLGVDLAFVQCGLHGLGVLQGKVFYVA